MKDRGFWIKNMSTEDLSKKWNQRFYKEKVKSEVKKKDLNGSADKISPLTQKEKIRQELEQVHQEIIKKNKSKINQK